MFGKQDPYVLGILCDTIQHRRRTSECESGACDPVWDDCEVNYMEFPVNLSNPQDMIIEIWDERVLDDEKIGSFKVNLQAIFQKLNETGMKAVKTWFNVDTGGNLQCTFRFI